MLSLLPNTPPHGNKVDLSLTRAVARRDHEACKRLTERLHERVRATVSYLAGPERDQEDLVQLCLVEILRSASNFQGHGRLESWADRIVARTTFRRLRRRRRSRSVEILGEATSTDELAAQVARNDLEQEAVQRDLHRRLATILQRLSPERRMAVVLHWVQGHSVREIAELTDTRINTVRGRLREGKKQLRSFILADPILRHWEGMLSR